MRRTLLALAAGAPLAAALTTAQAPGSAVAAAAQPAVVGSAIGSGAAAAAAAPAAQPAAQTLEKARDVAAIRSWSFLKKSMVQLGVDTQEVLRVRADLRAMEEDLRAQQAFWDDARAKLSQENSVLMQEVKRREKKLLTDSKWTSAYIELQNEAKVERQKSAFAESLLVTEKQSADAERELLMKRRERMDELQRAKYREGETSAANALAHAQASSAAEKQIELELEQAQFELEDLKSLKDTSTKSKGVRRAKYVNALEKLTLEVADLEKRMKLPGDVEGETKKLQKLIAGAQKESEVLVTKKKGLKTQHASEMNTLNAKRKQLKQTLDAKKLNRDQFCTPIQSEHQELLEQLKSRNCVLDD